MLPMSARHMAAGPGEEGSCLRRDGLVLSQQPGQHGAEQPLLQEEAGLHQQVRLYIVEQALAPVCQTCRPALSARPAWQGDHVHAGQGTFALAHARPHNIPDSSLDVSIHHTKLLRSQSSIHLYLHLIWILNGRRLSLPGCQEASSAEQEGEGWSALLRKRYRRIMVLAAGLPLLQQGSGINTVILYSSQVPAFTSTTKIISN